jgi:hypothetical protein
MSWIFGTISLDLQDIVRTPDGTARDAWLALKSQSLGNAHTLALQLDAELCTLEQGDLSVAEFCWKMKRTANAVRDLGYPVPSWSSTFCGAFPAATRSCGRCLRTSS